ncbi:hypothetical protein [Halospeciosus flavus]|uniref:Uncharacterized protein n=1 Tax=Halospeciosus flavus TaxID=3032283 RepID=A0ABD5YZ04_9EURY
MRTNLVIEMLLAILRPIQRIVHVPKTLNENQARVQPTTLIQLDDIHSIPDIPVRFFHKPIDYVFQILLTGFVVGCPTKFGIIRIMMG